LIFLLAYVHPNASIRENSLEAINKLDKYLNELNLSVEMYEAIKEYSESQEAKGLKGSDQKLLKDTLRDLEHNGLGLPEEERKKVKDIQDNISDLSIQFESNIAAYKDEMIVTEEEMEGLPEDYKAERKRKDGKYKIDLTYPSYFPFMKYSESDEARKELSKRFKNIASDKNIEVLEKLLEERNKLIDVHGYRSFAEYQLKNRMAKNPENVWDFETSLKEKVDKKAEIDYQQLLAKKREVKGDSGIEKVHSWESAFYTTKILRENYQVDDEEVKQYFELDNVINGLFDITGKLFNIQYHEIEDPNVWHEDVRMFEVYENAQLLGRFYLDLFPRDNKFNHAACFGIIPGKQTDDGYQLPHASLVTNFPKPSEETPALLTHSDVVTLFHEFGHLLHDLLTKAPFSSQAGTNTVRDFVEVPSQILENWAWQYEALQLFAKHYKTGEVLPRDLHKKMTDARNVGSGLFTLQQIFYGTLDMTYHDKYDPRNSSETTTEILKRLQDEITYFDYMSDTYFQAGFGHLVGYAAGYYGYLWAKVYAEDMFSVFRKEGILNKEMGQSFKEKVLEMGSSREEKQIVFDFLGREAKYDAFLESIGLD
jgi:thimet oligopeptidase